MTNHSSDRFARQFRQALRLLIGSLLVMALLLASLVMITYIDVPNLSQATLTSDTDSTYTAPDSNMVGVWTGPAEWRMASVPSADKALITYGRDLIAHTSQYLGPKGSVRQISNGMNCQNCHLNAGTQPWGNNYFAVQSTYPKFRERSGTSENQIKRVNDCFQRSLNGQALDSSSREMKAILAYIQWLGTGVEKKVTPRGAGIYKIKDLKRAADPDKGALVYSQKCQSCHQPDGGGVLAYDGKSYTYPPLWGKNSYNIGAGLYRLSNFAGYAKYNMPLGATYQNPQLTDEEAWDVAAFVNSQPRPFKELRQDWPNLAGKPHDHPFGPYADSFSETQHKYGPFKAIKEWKKQHKDLKTPNPFLAKK